MPSIDVGLIITAVNNASNSIKTVEGDVKRLGTSSQATANRLKAIQVVIAGIVLNKTLELGRAFVEVAAKNQLADVRLSNFTGSAKTAAGVMERFTATIAASGVQNDSLADAMARLTAAGLGTADAQKTITNLVNGITALGSSDVTGALQGATTAFQRFLSKGVVSTRELNAIVNSTGLTVQEMADAMGMSVTQFYENLQDKTMRSKTLLDGFNKAAEQKFGGFAALLGSTVGGALNKFKFDLDEALGSLGSRTTLNSNIVAIIQNLENAVIGFVNSIKQKDIENFFNFLRDAEPTVRTLINAMLKAGSAVLILADVTSRFLNMLPDDAVEYGIIGYVLLGKKGALLGALISKITNGIPGLVQQDKSIAEKYNALPETNGSKYQTLLDGLNKAYPNQPGMNMLRAWGITLMATSGDLENKYTPAVQKAGDAVSKFFGEVGKGSKAQKSIFGSPEQIKAIQKMIEDLQKGVVNPGKLSGTPDNVSLSETLDKLRTATRNTLEQVTGKDLLLKMQNAGDTLGQTIQQIDNQTQGWINSLDTARTNIETSKLPLSEQKSFLEQIDILQIQINADTAKAIDLAMKLNNIKQDQIKLDQESARLQLEQTNRGLQRQLQQITSPQNAILSGTAGGSIVDQVDEQRLQYQQQIIAYMQQIDSLQSKILTDPQNADQYRSTIEQLQQAVQLTGELANQTSYSVTLQTQFYHELGQTLESDLTSGITGLIQGTKTWGDVGRQIFGDLIAMSVKYLLQLIEIKAMTALLGVFGFADGGVMGGKVVPFASGGVPSRSGDLITGPTLFGLAGEAGTEAIMPLTRIGGKLGVRAQGGGGGNHYSISIQAIDTQTGMEFVAQHIESIEAGLRHNQLLGTRR